jgi:hypothetical protein
VQVGELVGEVKEKNALMFFCKGKKVAAPLIDDSILDILWLHV